MSIEDRWVKNEFGGPEKLHKFLKRNKTDLSQYKTKKTLSLLRTYQLHKPTARRFRRRKVIVTGPDEMVDVDLLDLKGIGGNNYGKRYLLTAVDTFSRKAYACPLKDKSATKVADCFSKMLNLNEEFAPLSIRTDHGR